MATTITNEHIEITPGIAGGKPRIAGHRITVQNIAIWHERLGRSVDEIAAEHGLTLADIHAALAYYFDHRAEIDRSISEGEAFAEALRAGCDFHENKGVSAVPRNAHAEAVQPCNRP